MKKFKKIYIEITNICNMNCSFCSKMKRKPLYMSMNNFNNILNKIQGYTKYLYLHVKGEPLMHPQLDSFLKLCYEKGFKVNITTNGTLLKEKEQILLSSIALRQVNISLHSMENFRSIQEMDLYIKRVFKFVSKCIQKGNIYVSLRLWNLDDNNLINVIKNRNNRVLSIIEKHFNLPYKIREKITPGKNIKLDHNVFLHQDAQFQWPSLDLEPISDEGFCYGLRNQVAILVDGTVVPCCLDGDGIIKLGNIFEDDFYNIINSDVSKRIIQGFSNRKVVEELCKRCGFRERFNK